MKRNEKLLSDGARDEFRFPKNGPFILEGKRFIAVEGRIYSSKSGEDFARELSEAENITSDKLGLSIIKSSGAMDSPAAKGRTRPLNSL